MDGECTIAAWLLVISCLDGGRGSAVGWLLVNSGLDGERATATWLLVISCLDGGRGNAADWLPESSLLDGGRDNTDDWLPEKSFLEGCEGTLGTVRKSSLGDGGTF